MIHHDYAKARDALLALVKAGVEEVMSRTQYADLVLTLAEAELELGHYDATISTIGTLPDELEVHHQLQGGLLLSRAHKGQGELAEAFLVLKALEPIVPKREWRGEDRALFTSLAIALDDRYHEKIKIAENALNGGLQEEALSHYLEVWRACEEGVFPNRLPAPEQATMHEKVQLRIGEVLYGLKEWALLQNHLAPVRERLLKDREASPYLLRSLRLIGLAHQRQGQLALALGTFQIYLQISPNSPERDEVAWDTGLLLLELGERERALTMITEVTRTAAPSLAHLAELYLSRLDLQARLFPQVERRLEQLVEQVDEDDPLRAELAFLQGEAALHQAKFMQAVQLYSKALSDPHPTWEADARHGLGWAYLNLATGLEGDVAAQVVLFDQAQGAFEALHDDERAYLGLAHLYLSQAPLLGEDEARKRAHDVLARPERFTSCTAQAEALMLRAHLSDTYLEREALYSLLTDDRYLDTPQYAQGWYRRGINHYMQAEQMAGAPSLYSLAAEALATAHPRLKAAGSPRAPLALKFWAEAERKQGKLEEAHALLLQLLEEPSAPYDEVLYLLGSLGSQLNKPDAQDHFEELLENYPASPFAPKALVALGNHYFEQGYYVQAQNLFLSLAEIYPNNPLAGEGLFWAAECEERSGGESQNTAQFRTAVFEHYPNSPFASESYFRLHPFSAYLEGEPAALQHLKEMPRRFPDSPFLVLAHYLRGLEAQRQGDQKTAAEGFARAASTFDRHWITGTLPAHDQEYFASLRYRALVELGLTHLSVGKASAGADRLRALQAAKEALTRVIHELADHEHPLHLLITSNEPYPRLLEETEFAHVQVLLELGDDQETEAAIATMLGRYHQAGIEQGYYLSRIWYTQGCLARASGRADLALSCFYHSEDSAIEGMLSDQQRLDLWLQQSNTLTALGQLEEGMLLLSRIINDESASPLRVEAMFQRAQLYALQGREELAIKQLEATAKKSGPWAEEARQKLEAITS